MPPSITQNRDTAIEVSGDRVSFSWNGEHHTLPLSMVGVAYAKPKVEALAEETKAPIVTVAASKAKPKGRPGRKPGFKVKKQQSTPELDQAIAGATASGKRGNNGALTAN